MKRVLFLLYGLGSYALFFGTFLYAIGFLGNLGVPTTIDGEPTMSLAGALTINVLLLGVFAVQHSVMARPSFKRWWTRFVPVPIERSTYVLLSSVAMLLIFWQWQPLGGIVWSVEAPWAQAVLWTLYGLGWVTVFVSTCLINHFDLFGVRQVVLYALGKEYKDLPFVTPGPYRLVRHPLYVGWIMTFWAAPVMSVTHLVFSLATTAYILVAIQFEERNLVDFHADYADYKKRVPMLIPRVGRRSASAPASVADLPPQDAKTLSGSRLSA